MPRTTAPASEPWCAIGGVSGAGAGAGGTTGASAATAKLPTKSVRGRSGADRRSSRPPLSETTRPTSALVSGRRAAPVPCVPVPASENTLRRAVAPARPPSGGMLSDAASGPLPAEPLGARKVQVVGVGRVGQPEPVHLDRVHARRAVDGGGQPGHGRRPAHRPEQAAV